MFWNFIAGFYRKVESNRRFAVKEVEEVEKRAKTLAYSAGPDCGSSAG
jgi:hypothetical protein